MKRLLLPAVAITLLLTLASCEKCKTCTATVTTTTTITGMDPTTTTGSTEAEYCGDALKEVDGETVSAESTSAGSTIKTETKYDCN